MVQADQRRCLRQPISLDRRVAESAPEFFGLTVERGAARDQRQEFPPKFPANRAKNPPPVQEMLAFRRAEPPLKLFGLPMLLRIEVFEIAFDLLPERLQNPRHGHQHRHSLAPDRVHDFRWIQLLLKNYNPAQQRRQKSALRISCAAASKAAISSRPRARLCSQNQPPLRCLWEQQ